MRRTWLGTALVLSFVFALTPGRAVGSDGCIAVAPGSPAHCNFVATGPVGYIGASESVWTISLRHAGSDTLIRVAGSAMPGHPGTGVAASQAGDTVFVDIGCGLPFDIGSCSSPLTSGFVVAQSGLTQVPQLPLQWNIAGCVATMQHPVPDPRGIEIIKDWIPPIYRALNCRFVATTATVFYVAATPNPWQISECDAIGANCHRIAGSAFPNKPGEGMVSVTPGNVIDASIGARTLCPAPCPDRLGIIYAQSN